MTMSDQCRGSIYFIDVYTREVWLVLFKINLEKLFVFDNDKFIFLFTEKNCLTVPVVFFLWF
jgi:hypothetical protein